MGPTWVLSAPGGPHVGLMNLAIWDSNPTDHLSSDALQVTRNPLEVDPTQSLNSQSISQVVTPGQDCEAVYHGEGVGQKTIKEANGDP